MNQFKTTDPKTDRTLIEADRDNALALIEEAKSILATNKPEVIQAQLPGYDELIDALTASVLDLDELLLHIAEEDASDQEMDAVRMLRESQARLRSYTDRLRSKLEAAQCA